MATLTLFRISTGENWHKILESVSKKRDLDYQCVNEPTYKDYINNDKVPIGCGTRSIATIYFIFFIVIVALTFLDLFIAIIL